MADTIASAKLEDSLQTIAASLKITGAVPDLYFAPNIPKQLLARATARFATFDSTVEQPIMLFDMPQFFSATGLLATNKHLFYRYHAAGAIDLERVISLDLRSSQLVVNENHRVPTRTNTPYCESVVTVFLRRLISGGGDISPTEILQEFVCRIGEPILPDETMVKATDLFLLTDRRLVGVHSRWAVSYTDIIDIVVWSPDQIGHVHAIHGHPVISVGLQALKLLINRSNANDCRLKLHVRGRNVLTVNDSYGQEARFSRRDAEAAAKMINEHRQALLIKRRVSRS